MARKRSGTRHPDTVATQVFRSPSRPPVSPLLAILELEDRRLFHPEGSQRPAAGLFPSSTKVVLRDRPKAFPDRFGKRIRSQSLGFHAFKEPERVSVCVRRSQRRAVLAALSRGMGGMGKPFSKFKRRSTTNRRGPFSNVSCRR